MSVPLLDKIIVKITMIFHIDEARYKVEMANIALE